MRQLYPSCATCIRIDRIKVVCGHGVPIILSSGEDVLANVVLKLGTEQTNLDVATPEQTRQQSHVS